MARRSCEKGRLVELDSIRGLAALWVYAYHTWQFSGSPQLEMSCLGFAFDGLAGVHHGPAGVDLFMVLSGFCLFWPLTWTPDRPWQWREYAARRARRILPAYYAAIVYAILLPVALVLLVRRLGWQANMQPLPSPWQVATHLTLTHTFFRETWDGITGAFWSMGLEAQFYAVFPFFIMAWRRFKVRAIVYTAILSVLFRVSVALWLKNAEPMDRFLVSITFLGRWMQFAFGMLAALWVSGYLQRQERIGRSAWLGVCLGSIALVLKGLGDQEESINLLPWRELKLGAGYALLLCAVCASPEWLKVFFTAGPLPKLGRISYSFFLIHQPTSWYLMEFFRKIWGYSGLQQLWMGYTFGTLVTLVVSCVFFHLFEKPFLSAVPRQRSARIKADGEFQEVA
jgi:peptidoglycan/LPS O-acetylase OafA/YrhL